jgi:hypothetical protein
MALVGGAVVITIALLSGIASLSSLAMLLALMVAGCLLIFPAEVLHIERPKGMLSHVVCGVGTMAILAPLAIFAIGICGSLMYDGTIPAYLYGVYATAAVAVGLGIFITHFRMLRRGKLVDSYYTEGVYMVLGFLAVSALAWQIFVGIL